MTLSLTLVGCGGVLPDPSSTSPASSVEPSSQSSSSDPSSEAPSSEQGSSAAPSSQAPSSQPVVSSEPSSQEPSSEQGSQSGHSDKEVQEYMAKLAETSQADHFYLHYYRYKQTAEDYNDWDLWCWPYIPKAGEGYRFDWDGRTTSADRLTATGDAKIDNFGYATVDVDLTAKYDGGWNDAKRTMGGKETNFYKRNSDELDTFIGVQIVYSDSRIHGKGFWVNDGSNLFVKLEEYEMTNKNGSKSYHVFVTQDNVQSPTTLPPIENVDPFDGDDGTNVTYGTDKYKDVNFKQVAAKQKTAKLFYQGDSNVNYMKNGAGVGYQIMVSSFADSDGDGFGDILGITEKLDYLKELGVNVLWLTPVQLSDSYHGYDIADYTQVDPRYGSTKSKHVGADGLVTSESAMKDYMDLIEAAHSNGMAVIMDLVLNHTSTTNKWFIDSAQLQDGYRGYYQWGNHSTQSQYINQEKFWYPYGDHVYSYYAKFGSSMPELNYACVSTRAAVAAIACQWCEAGVDGFRMDAVKHIFLNDEIKADSGDKIIDDKSYAVNGAYQDYSSNLTKNLHFWRQLNADVKKNYPNAFFVGENFDGHAYNVAPYYEGFDSLFDFYGYFNLTTMAAKAWGVNASTIYGGPASAQAFFGGPNSTPGTDAQGNKWDYYHVFQAYKNYRGDNPIAGVFTSNHDIARTINRIAGTGKQGDDGISAQGNVTTSNFRTLDQLATLVQITELMMPGCTWIYYGDEIGMTGNFPNTTYDIKMVTDGKVVTRKYDKDAPYSDLWYRQPMKWTANGKVGDGSYTTGFNVTGSGMTVGWDDINGSSLMKSVAEQKSTSGSHYNAIKAFANMKSKTPALIRGGFEDKGWGGKYVVNLWRTLGTETYAFVANFTNENLTMGYGTDGWKTVTGCTYNGATGTSLPPRSCILLKK